MNIAEKLVRERRARLAAERLLDQKARELHEANARLSDHARNLSDTVLEQRHGLAEAESEREVLKGRTAQAESELERAHAALKQAQRRLWEALETIRDGFAVFDADLRLIIANGAFVALFRGRCELQAGQSYDHLIRMLAQKEIVDLDGGDEHDWHNEMIARLMRDDIPPKTVKLTDGRFVKFIDRRGEAGDLVCLISDITDVMRREAELEEARAKAEAASRAKSAFLANMSHEIRTPMNGVVGMADLLCETNLSDEQKLFAETIKSSGEALLQIINDVLDYSKAEADKLRLYPEPFDLEHCLHEVMLLLQPSAREKGVSLNLDFDLFLPTRYVADPGRTRQILTNLIGNAVKFTQEGHVLARVVGMPLDGGRYDLHISIEDTGIGIAPEHVGHIFGEFNQVEDQSNRKFEGTGLGLAITRQLVELMGGEIWVDSEPGRGSCFGFRIAVEAAEPLPEEPADRPITLRRALVLDAALLGREILSRQLAGMGLGVESCRTAAEAVNLMGRGPGFDLVMVDQDLSDGASGPGRGVEISAQLRGAGYLGPILLYSTAPMNIRTSAGLVQGLMQKPILRSDLFRRLQDLSETARPAEPPPPPATRVEPASLRRMRVLAAEDNRTNQLVFRKMVQAFDIDLVFAENGREAVEHWRTFRPDLIFMDISMPGMDGREATRAIRTAEAEAGLGEHVPIVAMTAHAMDGDSDSIIAAGVDHYLTKPLKKAAIGEQIVASCPKGARPPAADAPDA
ncbi:ATP-binding protein [Frigidibacter sp. SD6-1]|uniref:ATP-binding protein n=1 Tax=Frigidibacter sp. SD6-1 TaxID=3032581 RepID=UPI0024DFBCD7|nr:ATP-binding protein [Frigidibacter sp. SD6-1]